MSEPSYEKYYTESTFWEKLTRFARIAGKQVVEKALTLYYAARNPDTPAWARATIYGALGYFILPTDAIPDIIPGAGYADDLGALALAIAVVTGYITPTVKKQAADKLASWFPAIAGEGKVGKSAADGHMELEVSPVEEEG